MIRLMEFFSYSRISSRERSISRCDSFFSAFRRLERIGVEAAFIHTFPALPFCRAGFTAKDRNEAGLPLSPPPLRWRSDSTPSASLPLCSAPWRFHEKPPGAW